MLLSSLFFLFVVAKSLPQSSTDNPTGVLTTPQIPTLPKILNQITHCNTNSKCVPKNCKEVQDQGQKTSDLYYIQPKFSSKPFPVVCDMKTRGGGWTYILNRFNGSEDFYLEWDCYKNGFGNLAGEFWLGLENIHFLTGYEFNELLVELVDWDNKQVDAHYHTFIVGPETDGFALEALEGFSGSAGDSLKVQAGMKFTTKDKDQDLWNDGNCADFSHGPWWHRNCKQSNLAGKYYENSKNVRGKTAMYWQTSRGDTYCFKEARMMVRPRNGGATELSPKAKFA